MHRLATIKFSRKQRLTHKQGNDRTQFGAWLLIAAIALSLIAPALLVKSASAAGPFVVDRTDDTNVAAAQVCGPAANDCSLRGAISKANGLAGADIIHVPAGTYTLSITGNAEQNNATGDLDILDSLTIIGANGDVAGDPAATIIKGAAGWDDKIIDINPNLDVVLDVTIQSLTVRDGNNTSASDFYGGGIQMFGRASTSFSGAVGSLTLDNCIVTNNHLTSSNQNEGGGGLLVEQGHATINNCTFSNNSTADEPGGGIATIGAGDENFTITNSTVTGNSTGGDSEGAGIYVRRESASGRPNLSATILIDGNTISNNLSHSRGGGLSFVAGDGANPLSGMTVTIRNNTISGNKAGDVTGGEGAGSVAEGGGIYWSSNNTAIPFNVTKNTITGNSLDAAHSDRRGGGGIAIGQGGMTATFNRFANNTIGATGGANLGTGLRKDGNAGSVTATNNWWGCSSGSTAAPCDTAVLITSSGSLTSSPFLQLKTTASPSTLVTNQTSSLTTSFNTNSDGADVSADIDVLLGLPVTWSAVGGSISSAQTSIQTAGGGKGSATATYTASTATASNSGTAVVDNGPTSGSTNTAAITANKANTTAAISADTPDPSVTGQSYTVSFSVTGAQSNSPTGPTGNVQVSDGSATCTGSVATGSCTLTSFTAGAKTLTGTYQGDGNFNASAASSGVSHQVDKANTTATITSDSPDPSDVGQAVLVQFTISTDAPGSGTPTGNVTVSDGNESCTATVAVGQCIIAFSGTGDKTLTATYAGDGNYNASPASSGISHTITPSDLVITKSAAPSSAVPGDLITYTLSFTNSGPSVAYNVVVSDSVPVSVTVSAVTSSTVGSGVFITQTSGSPNFAWTTSDLAVGAGGYITLTGTLDPYAALIGTQISNSAGITASNDSTDTNNVSSAEISVTDVPCFATPDNGGTVYASTDADAVQLAIDAAADGGTVKLAGTCVGVQPRTYDYLGTTVTLPQTGYISKSLEIRGGYTTTNWSTSDALVNPTRLDADGEGQVLVLDGADIVVTVENLSVTNGSSVDISGGGTPIPNGGGGISVFIATVTISNALVYNNYADSDGGGLSNFGGTLSILNSAFYDNYADFSGGAIENFDGHMTLDNSHIYTNTSDGDGGGITNISFDTTALLTVTNGTLIEDNMAYGAGGGLFNDGGEIVVDASSVVSNTTCCVGGGIANIFGLLTITNTSQVSYNFTGGDGGGIFNLGDALIRNSRVIGNATGDGSAGDPDGDDAGVGGGIYTDGFVEIAHSEILSNTTGSGGSGSDFGGWGGDGGGIYVDEYGSLVIASTTVSGNQTGAGGLGGIDDGYGGVGGGIAGEGTMTVANTTITDNTAEDDGGGIASGGALTVTNSTVSRNTAGDDGGGIDNDGDYTLIRDSWITENFAYGSGGGLDADGVTEIENSHVLTNTADGNNGGGINSSEPLTITGSLFQGNYAYNDGGAIFASDGTVTMADSTVSDNEADYGGGIASHTPVTVTGSLIQGNIAYSEGGGLIFDDTLYMTGTQVLSNSAVYDWGGGLTNYGDARIMDSTFSGNDAPDGGAIDIEEGTLTLENSRIVSNTAAYAGGAIYNYLGVAELSNTPILSNTAGEDGGAIKNDEGWLTLTDSTVAYNTAWAGLGGGVVNATGQMTITGSFLESNQAANGGGLATFFNAFPSGGCPGICADALSISAAPASGKKPAHSSAHGTPSSFASDVSANVSAGGPSLSAAAVILPPTPLTTISDTVIRNNRAAFGGGGIWNEDAASVTIDTSSIVSNTVTSSGDGTVDFSENFDGVSLPNLPTDWTTSATGVGVSWAITTTGSHSAPNSLVVPNPDDVGESILLSPIFTPTADGRVLSFRLRYDTEYTYDGVVLEIKIGSGGVFTDILDAGGTFLAHGYNTTLDNCCSNPLSDRQAWSGYSGTYVNVLVNLPANGGQGVQLRWRMGSDDDVAGVGVWLDDVQVWSPQGQGGGIYNATAGSAITVTNSSFLSNTADNGGALYQAEGTSSVSASCIVNNSDTAVVYIDGTSPITATTNWWGHRSGPSGVGPGLGDSVSDNVDYTGFLGAANLGCPTLGDPDLAVTKTVEPGSAEVGDAITYTLSFSNTGARFSRSVIISDSMPVSVTVSGVSSSTIGINSVGGSVLITQTSGSPLPAIGGTFAWVVSDLAVGAGGTITLTGTLSNSTALVGTTINNTAHITASNDVTTTNNSSTAGVEVIGVGVGVSPASVAEDGAVGLTYTFTRTGPTADALTVGFSLGGSATFASDYSQNGADSFNAGSGSITIPKAQSTVTMTVTPTADATVELDETVSITVSDGLGYGVDTPSSATATISNDDSASLSMGDVSHSEGDSGTVAYTFTVTLTQSVDTGLSVDFATADNSATTADNDYSEITGTLIFAGNAGETRTLVVQVNGDETVELDEAFLVNLSNLQAGGRSVSLGNSQAVGTISNDDSASLSIGDVSHSEGDSGTVAYTFTVTLTQSVDTGLSVDFATADGSATTANNDYSEITGTLSFTGNAGETRTLVIQVNGDDSVELDEAFLVNLSNLQAGGRAVSLGNSQAVGTITNDDEAILAIAKAASSTSLDEGQPVTYTVVVSNTGTGTATDVTVTDSQTGSLASGVTLAAGNVLTFTYNVTTDDGPLTVVNTATVTSTQTAPVSAGVSVAWSNVAPTASFSNDGPVAEGSNFSLSLNSPFDPSATDTAALTYAFDCGDGSGFGTFTTASSANCATDDDGLRTVRATVQDDDGGSSTYTATVTIDNVAPTLTLPRTGPDSVDEGSTYTLTLESADDPGADTVSQYTVDWNDGEVITVSSSGPVTVTHVYVDGTNTYTVSIDLTDEDGLYNGVTTRTVNVANVAPTASLSNDGPVNEGGSALVSFAGQSDPSTTDTTSGFLYSYDFDNDGTFEISGSSTATASVPAVYLTAVSSRTVRARIADKDGGFSDSTTVITVLQPLLAVSKSVSPASVDESETVAYTVVVSNTGTGMATDVTVSDSMSGTLDSGFSLGSGAAVTYTYSVTVDDGPLTLVNTATVTSTQTSPVSAAASVTWNNVAPTASLSNNGPVNEGGTAVVSFAGQFDPSTADTTSGFLYSYDFNNDGVFEISGSSTATASVPAGYLTAVASRTVGARIADKDGGFSDSTTTILVNALTATPTSTSTPTQTTTVTPTPTQTSTATSTTTPTPTFTPTPMSTSTGTGTVTGTPTATLSPTGTTTATGTPTGTATTTPTPTSTGTPTGTPTATATSSPTPTPSSTATPTATPTEDTPGGTSGDALLYLPQVRQQAGSSGQAQAPDLVISQLHVSGSAVQIEIRNVGTVPAVDEFWVDVYIAPSPAPSAVNQIWPGLGSQGMVWGVTDDLLPLAPGQSLLLTTGDTHYAAEFSFFTTPIAGNVPVYAQVDSWNSATGYGAVLESHEIAGTAYNNISGPVMVTAAAGFAPVNVGEPGQGPVLEGLPARSMVGLRSSSATPLWLPLLHR